MSFKRRTQLLNILCKHKQLQLYRLHATQMSLFILLHDISNRVQQSRVDESSSIPAIKLKTALKGVVAYLEREGNNKVRNKMKSTYN